MKKRIVSGITATGKLTIGNYIGAIKNMVKLQNDFDLFVFVADLHALTIDLDPEVLRNNRKTIMALYIACGLDIKKTTLFYQSDVNEHALISWIFENRTTIGELERMTQFKDKSQKNKEANGTVKIKTGLLTYPALMAGDIILYNASVVPVGKDQQQHLELTRNIAQRFNNQYGETFIVPEIYLPEVGAKIMSLSDPTKKMSKSSDNPKSYISLLDDPELAFNKIKKAVTDSENKVYISDKPEKAGIRNLLSIYASLKEIDLVKAEEKFKNYNYGEFKIEVGEVVRDFLIDLQNKFNKALEEIDNVAEEGAKRASAVAKETIKIIKKKIGLI